MDELIEMIESTVDSLLKVNYEEYAQKAQQLVDVLYRIIPSVIAVYSDPRMSDLAGDAVYWPEQLKRIINALENGDDYSTIDVLYNETRANIIELKDVLNSRGIL